MVLNILKFTLQKEKKRIFIFKYCKIDVKSAATLIFAATLITAPTVSLNQFFIILVLELQSHNKECNVEPLMKYTSIKSNNICNR
jgi:hypothetical protein